MSDTNDNIEEVVEDATPSVLSDPRLNNLSRKGRPRGAISINSAASIKRLQELGFDPLERLVIQYDEVTKKISDMENGTTKYSAIAMSNLETLRKGIADTLVKYSYRAVPSSNETTVENKTPLKITLTGIDL